MTKRKMPWSITLGNPARQGISRTQKGFNFAVRVPEGAKASLLLYKRGSSKVEYEIPLPEEDRIGEVSAVKLEPMEAGKWEYNYRLGGKVQPDVYTKMLRGREKFGAPMPESGMEHKIRGGLPEKPALQTKPLHIPYEDLIIYKTHVRGFTRQGSSKVRKKGTFTGVTEKIPYLKALGINALELMPVYEFWEIPQQEHQRQGCNTQRENEKINYWGYGSALYFAPKASFAATADPVAEFAFLVDSLHREGIECILEFYFGPDTNAGLVLDVLHYWQLNFGVDGFHLLGDGDWVNLAAKDVLLRKTKLIFLGYDTGAIYGERKNLYYRNLSEHNLGFQHDMRRFLKGDEGCVEAASYRLRRNPEKCAVINYFADHDGFTMADMVTYEQKHNEANGENNRDGSSQNYTWNCGVEGSTRKKSVRNLRMRQLKNAWLMLLTAQGTPMIYGGDEFCNSARGNNNSYCQDNEVGWVEWNQNKLGSEMLEFVKKCVEFRKAHPILHMQKEPRLLDYKSLGCPDLSYHGERAWYTQMEYNSHVFGAMYCGDYMKKPDGTGDDYIYIAYNMHWDPEVLALPTLPEHGIWKLAVDTSREEAFGSRNTEDIIDNQRKLTVPPRCVLILVSEKLLKPPAAEKRSGKEKRKNAVLAKEAEKDAAVGAAAPKQ